MNTLPITPSEPIAAIDAGGGYPELPEVCFYTAFARYVGGGEEGWIPLPGYSNETEHGVKDLILQAARKEGYKGTVTGRLLELGWEIRPVYDSPSAALRAAQVAAQPSDDWSRDRSHILGAIRDAGFALLKTGHFRYSLAPAIAGIAEAATPSPVAPVQAAQADEMDMDAFAVARYKVVPADGSMFWSHAVVAGDGSQQLYMGREVECQNMARKFSGAFLDGVFACNERRAALSAPSIESKGVREVADDKTWCQYVAGMVGGYLGWSVDDARLTAVSEIIRRRLRFLAPAAPITAVPAGQRGYPRPMAPNEYPKAGDIWYSTAQGFILVGRNPSIKLGSFELHVMGTGGTIKRDACIAEVVAAPVPGVAQPPADAVNLTDEQCDSICDGLDQWATSIASYELGLPLWGEEHRARSREIIRDAAMPPSQPASDAKGGV